MKLFTTFLLLCIGISTFAQKKLKKLIELDTPSKIEKFMEKGGNVDTLIYYTNEEGIDREVSPLMFALVFEYFDVFNYFLENKKIFKDFDHYLNEVFIYSLSHGSDSLSEKLYVKNVDINDHCSLCHENNALMVAAVSGNEKWYFKLKENSDVYYVNPDGNSLLHAAAESPSEKIIKDVLSIEWQNINTPNKYGRTPLDYTVWNEEYPEAFNLFLEAGASYQESDHLCLKFGYHPNVEIGTFVPGLVAKMGDSIFITDEEGYNLLDYAAYFFNDKTSEDHHAFLNSVIQVMKNELQDNNSAGFDNDFLYDKEITFNIIDISYQFDEDPEYFLHLFRNYLEFIGLAIAKGYNSPISKKEFKYACRRFGKEYVELWFEELQIPIPD
jgi:ankyrin repeat protein